MNLAYHYHYGDHRCNLAQDSELQEGVYAYVDIEDALKNLDKAQATDRTMCIGLVSGYLNEAHAEEEGTNEFRFAFMQVVSNLRTLLY